MAEDVPPKGGPEPREGPQRDAERGMTTEFADPDRHFGGIDSATLGRLVGSATDIAIVIGADGTILDIAQTGEDLDRFQPTSWIGMPVEDIVTEESRQKIQRLMADARSGAAGRRREINHPTIAGEDDVPISYTAAAGAGGEVVLLGRDLRPLAVLQSRLIAAQQSVEQDYERLREMEARYRVLFQHVSDAFLVVDAADGRLIEANPSAAMALGREAGEIAGKRFSALFAKSDRQSIDQTLAGVLASARSDRVGVTLAESGERATLTVTLFRAADATLFLVRLSTEAHGAAAPPLGRDDGMTQLLFRVPEAVVFADSQGTITWANEAFLEMTQLAMPEHAIGTSIGGYLGRPGVDMNVILANTRRHGRLRMFATSIRGAAGLKTDVELSAVCRDEAEAAGFAFVIRNMSMRPAHHTNGTAVLPSSAEQLTELIGRMPLKDVVREATDVIERLCIETALRLTGDNRASAAEMLGLSRQSLYVKMRRYELGDLGGQ